METRTFRNLTLLFFGAFIVAFAILMYNVGKDVRMVRTRECSHQVPFAVEDRPILIANGAPGQINNSGFGWVWLSEGEDDHTDRGPAIVRMDAGVTKGTPMRVFRVSGGGYNAYILFAEPIK